MSIDSWLEAIHSTNENVRLAAGHQLGDLGQDKTAGTSKLINALKDKSPTVRYYATIAIGDFDLPSTQTVPVLLELLTNTNQLHNYSVLSYKKSDSVIEEKSANEIAYQAAIALGKVGRPAIPALSSFLRQRLSISQDTAKDFFTYYHDPSAELAALALSRIGPDAAQSLVAIALAIKQERFNSYYKRRLLINTLHRMGSEVMPELLSFIKTQNTSSKEAQQLYKDVLDTFGSTLQVTPQLEEPLATLYSKEYQTALLLLPHLSDSAAVPYLTRAFKDASKKKAAQLSEVLSELPESPQAAALCLQLALTHSNSLVRTNAARAFDDNQELTDSLLQLPIYTLANTKIFGNSIANQRAVTRLKELLTSADSNYYQPTLLLLPHLSKSIAVPYLTRAFKDASKKKAAQLSEVLSELPESPQAAALCLQLALTHSNSLVRTNAAQAFDDNQELTDSLLTQTVQALSNTQPTTYAAARKLWSYMVFDNKYYWGNTKYHSSFFGRQDLVPLLLTALQNHSSDQETIAKIAVAANRIGPAATPIIKRLERDLAIHGNAYNAELKSAILRAMGTIRPSNPEVVQVLASYVQDTAKVTRSAALASLKQVGNAAAGAVSNIVPLLQADDDYTPREAAATLVALGSTGEQSLINALQSQNAQVREIAAANLADCQFEKELVLSALLEAVQDSNSMVRGAAVSSLISVVQSLSPNQQTSLIPRFLLLLNSPKTVSVSTQVLCKIGNGRLAVVKALLAAARQDTITGYYSASRYVQEALEDVVDSMLIKDFSTLESTLYNEVLQHPNHHSSFREMVVSLLARQLTISATTNTHSLQRLQASLISSDTLTAKFAASIVAKMSYQLRWRWQLSRSSFDTASAEQINFPDLMITALPLASLEERNTLLSVFRYTTLDSGSAIRVSKLLRHTDKALRQEIALFLVKTFTSQEAVDTLKAAVYRPYKKDFRLLAVTQLNKDGYLLDGKDPLAITLLYDQLFSTFEKISYESNDIYNISDISEFSSLAIRSTSSENHLRLYRLRNKLSLPRIRFNTSDRTISYVMRNSSNQTKNQNFPIPPPLWSAAEAISSAKMPSLKTLGDAHQKITEALRAAGFGELGVYDVDSGFAIVTKVERVRDDGTSYQGRERWSDGQVPIESLTDYFTRLIMVKPGQFRMIAIIITPLMNLGVEKSRTLSVGAARQMVMYGGRLLSPSVAKIPFTNYYMHTLVYHYERRPGQAALCLRPSTMDARSHLRAIGVLAKLGM